ncbi:MAG: redox-sensing transcriptional repressor Rex [Bryobacteraceae bacterium]
MPLRPIPEPTLRRLPLYYHHLKGLERQGIVLVSCTMIGKDLGLDPTQIRKDFETTEIVGKPKVGYGVPALIRAIESCLGWNQTKAAVIAGAGSLGRALLQFKDFSSFGLRVVAIFDAEENIGHQVDGLEVLPLGFLPDLARLLKVRIGILTLPAMVAQHAAELMLKGGVRAVWNFAPVALRVPPDVIVQNEDLYYSLAALSAKLARSEGEQGS